MKFKNVPETIPSPDISISIYPIPIRIKAFEQEALAYE